jgi:hypothetical protein
MQIIIKNKGPQKNSISYKRDDQLDYWQEANDFLVMHDLSHYAIETTLNFTTAFLGIIKRGVNPMDFENKETRDRLILTVEAWYAETLANLFLFEHSQGKFEDFNAVFEESLKQTNPELPPLKLNDLEIEKIRKTYQGLLSRWRGLKMNEALVLEF